MSLLSALGVQKESTELKEAKKEINALKREVAKLKEELKKEKHEKKKVLVVLRTAETRERRKDEEIRNLKRQVEIDKIRLSSVESILQNRSHGDSTFVPLSRPITYHDNNSNDEKVDEDSDDEMRGEVIYHVYNGEGKDVTTFTTRKTEPKDDSHFQYSSPNGSTKNEEPKRRHRSVSEKTRSLPSSLLRHSSEEEQSQTLYTKSLTSNNNEAYGTFL